MKSILQYIADYFRTIHKGILIIVSLFTGALVFSNYTFGIDQAIQKNNSLPVKLILWYAVFLLAFGFPYLLYHFTGAAKNRKRPGFLLLLFIAPAIFSLKMSTSFSFTPGSDFESTFWDHILYWPALLVLIFLVLLIIWKLFDSHYPFYGIKRTGVNWKPYWILLLLMLPLIAVASTQPDFLAMYPKLQVVAGFNKIESLSWGQKLLYELSYGTDFFTIEVFFRGFLVLGFMKWAGKDAILPMACFYCTIHFGKPAAECISSYFGGMLLGIIVCNTRSILGGLLVHLGIAWMMEIGGYLGNQYLN
ncbi:MAG: CPBP family glutamic-type intramembrane protease [Chitinophagaceae bacterium]